MGQDLTESIVTEEKTETTEPVESIKTDDPKVAKPGGIFGKLFRKTESQEDGDGPSSNDQEQLEGQNISSLVTEHKIIKGSFIVQGSSIVVILFTQDGRQIQRTITSNKSYVSFDLS